MPQLAKLHVPTLFICGQYDEALPATTASYQRATPGSSMVIVADAAHLAMEDQPKVYVDAVRGFLHDIERK